MSHDDEEKPDQSGSHFPDHGHLNKWSRMRIRTRRNRMGVHLVLPNNMLYLFLVAGAIGMLLFASDYLSNRRERLEKKAAYDRANAVERNAKEQQRREYQKPNIDKQMRDFRLP